MRGNMSLAAMNAHELARVTREHDLPYWQAYRVFLEGLADGQSGAAGGGLESCVAESNFFKIALAEAEARAGNVARAGATLDEALANCERTGHREAELHRVRGETLFKRDPGNPALAEDALQTAIAVSKRQERAALNCARRSRWQNSIDQPVAPPKPTPSSRQRSKILRRRRSFRKLRRH